RRTSGRRISPGDTSRKRDESGSHRAAAVKDANPIRILVAEDHLIARVGVTTIVNLQPDMTVVAEAANGHQAIELYRKHTPDVTLLDLRMPIVSGIEAAE